MEKKSIKEWKSLFEKLYIEMRKDLGVKDLDVHVSQNDNAPTCVNFNIIY